MVGWRADRSHIEQHTQMSQDKVKLIGFWSSPFVLRVQWALSLKGIEYEYVEEDIANKSAMLLQYNPVHKKVPVLLHNGKPIVESLAIIEYLDDVWKNRPLLSGDPLERARSRFWAKYVDDMCVPVIKKLLRSKPDQNESDAEEARSILKTLESSLDPNKPFSGDESDLNFMEISIAWLEIWFRALEKVLDVKIVDDENTPLLNKWFRDVLEIDFIKKSIPPFETMVARYKDLHEKHINTTS
ncbi:glutathione transferase GST 23-like [Rutidosis leptorrhynchoides]|uniref:glutathione transferase GST 23-like n=1 Tax=Rutidosis leptorrhynchoides TaxID=125765 RepID=UPI003A99A9BC